MARAAVLVSLALVACGPAGGPDLQWAFEVPDGVAVLEHPPVSARERASSWIHPVPDLTVEAGDDAFLDLAYALAVDPAGRIFVLDQMAQNVKVYGADGGARPVLGAPGQGPGELSEVSPAIAVAGGRVLVADALNARFSAWSTDGEFLETMVLQGGEAVAADAESLQGFDDGTFVVAYPAPDVASGERMRFVRLDATGVVRNEYARMPVEYTRALISGRPGVLPMPRGRAQMAASADGRVYLTPADLYQVAAYDIDGRMRWALRVPWPREPLPDGEVDRAFDSASRGLRAMGQVPVLDAGSVVNVPDFLPALASLKVDGHGRVWAFPYVHGELAPDAAHPVDVYSAEGERLFSGVIEARFARSRDLGSAWVAAHDDWIYGFDVDEASDSQRVVRYRLDVPF